MNPITHALTGWCLAEAVPNTTHREKALITFAAMAPDLDGFGIFAELATRNTDTPLLWWTDYHHQLCHNLPFAALLALLAAAIARGHRLRAATLVFVAVHLHLIGDLAGSRGPDGYQWPIPYLFPFTKSVQLVWSGQWALNAWPNIALTVVLLAATAVLAWSRGESIVGLISRRADRAFVAALRARVPRRA
ncbi:MAG TPA: metal-dependent hydrolase [Thermoanaerobaculia bacterium]|nr:metal-dependent hydrolase [Thermoanaerobaculia bacterium]